MITKVQKWGNSLAVRIPRSVVRETQLSSGGTVDLSVHEGSIVIAPSRRRRYKLADLLKGVTKDNRHSEIATGDPVGREAW